MITNRQFRLSKLDVVGTGSIAEVVEKFVGRDALRWYIAQITDEEIVIEATFYDGEIFESSEGIEGRRRFPGRSVVLSIVPTGVGCNLGGYAGDAAPATNLLAATADYLVTNPNAVNASNFISMDENVLYTEGLCIDLFIKGMVDLYVPYANRVGLIVEKSSPSELDVVFNIVNTVRAVHGVDISEVVITEEAIGTRCVENDSGAFVGTVDRPQVIFNACEELLRKGVDAIAITTNVLDLPCAAYAKHFDGGYPNPVGGVEAIVSHLIVNRFQVPAVHAPMLNNKKLDLNHAIVDARGAGEMASVSGLACTLIGLRRAPQINPRRSFRCADVINLHNLLAVVSPADCLGGVPAIYAHKHGIPVIAVAENNSIMDVPGHRVGIDNAIEVHSYAEAAGVLLALKRGISLDSIRRPLPTLRHRLGQDALAEKRYRAQFA